MTDITPCLWFDTQGEEAARYWVSMFPNSSITSVQNWGPENPERQGEPLVVEFVLDGRPFTALNGGPEFAFSEAFSLQVYCKDQAEVDYYWDHFVDDGGQESDCGWCKDKFGFSWQIVPQVLTRLLADPDPERVSRAMQAMLKMQRLDVATFEKVAAS